MTVLKYLGGLLATAALLFLFLVNFSSVESSYECIGQTRDGGDSQPSTVYLQLEEYRWWVGLWSKSDAYLYVEIPNTFVFGYTHLDKVGHQYQIYEAENKFTGNFSTLSSALALSTHLGFFEGACKRKE
ncbi:MAG: hypothetical protein QUV35_03165 [Hydrogenophaga sp.]|uniref:hypothetical protein n=1 Tax=Hydrogenophaga sp. TaxID=1904254 RepID=UPI002635F1D8|nr:hypothetical protein [Hydrogenophaga sp.]MDM7941607.1 hypothetical protein [Hydrogenophaga sp.]